MTTRFPTEEHWGYQIGLRSHDTNMKRTRSLVKQERYRWTPYYNGRTICFDLWFVRTKEAQSNTVIKYDWNLTNPDDTRIFKKGGNTVNLTSLGKSNKHIIDCGHFSITGQYKIALTLTNMTLKEQVNYEPVDFTVNDFGRLGHNILQTIIVVSITVVLTLILNMCSTGFGIKPPG
jgi:hypothetical protein